MQVVKGNGPCNTQRIAHRKKAHDDGAWVREATPAFAASNEQGTSQAQVEQTPQSSLRGGDGDDEARRSKESA